MIETPGSYFQPLGSGCYGTAWALPDGRVLKTAALDGTADFIQWCYLRMQPYGKGSPEMFGLPEVEEFGLGETQKHCNYHGIKTIREGWWCVMPRYEAAKELRQRAGDNEHKVRDRCNEEGRDFPYGRVWGPMHMELAPDPGVKHAVKLIRECTDVSLSDLHAGNVMWDPVRKCHVVTDPSSDSFSGSGSSWDQPRSDSGRHPGYMIPPKPAYTAMMGRWAR